MAYCTIDDIKDQLDTKRLIQLTDDEGSGDIGISRVEKAICDADEEIDGYIGSRHSVPLAPTPAIIRKLSVDIAIYNLYARREQVPQSRVERYRNCTQFLSQVATGKISLGRSEPEGSPSEPEAPEMSAENPPRTFTRFSLMAY